MAPPFFLPLSPQQRKNTSSSPHKMAPLLPAPHACWPCKIPRGEGANLFMSASNESRASPHEKKTQNKKYIVHPPKQTWNLKMDPWKRRFLLETIISRFHVNFRGCTPPKTSKDPKYAGGSKFGISSSRGPLFSGASC